MPDFTGLRLSMTSYSFKSRKKQSEFTTVYSLRLSGSLVHIGICINRHFITAAFIHVDTVKRVTAKAQTKHKNGEERGFKWFLTWRRCAKWAGLSISQTADLLRFSCTTTG